MKHKDQNGKFSCLLSLLNHSFALFLSGSIATRVAIHSEHSDFQSLEMLDAGGFLYTLQRKFYVRLTTPHNRGIDMGEKGKKDKGGREKKKEPKMSLKEKRQAKKQNAKNKDYTA